MPGGTARSIGEGLGKVVGVIPLLGKPSAYIVENAGKGIHYVVVGLGDVVGETAARVGTAAGDVGNLVVFTLASAHAALDDATDAVQEKIRAASYDT